MKLPIVLAIAISGFLASCASSGQPHDSAAAVPPERLALLAHGINLNNWFAPWANPATYATAFRPEEAQFLKKAGFTVCRLPLGPDLLFNPSDPANPRPAIQDVDRGVRLLLDAGLAVIFDPVHGTSSDAAWESGLYHDPAFLKRVEIYWESLARHYSAFSPDRIFFEVMNEPHLTAREKVDPGWWQPVQESLVAAIRRGAPSNTIIVTGELWGGIDGLLRVRPLKEGNLVYSFHWYDPFTFTHQGATWTDPIQAELSGVPYPSSPDAVRNAASLLSDPKARERVIRYGNETWDKSRVREGLSRAAQWGEANHVPVFCGEFGVYRKVAPPADRLAWIRDVRGALESMGVGWCMWDYETDFGLVTYSEPGWRRGPQVDSGCLTALGLDATQSISLPAQPTAHDFSSGVTQTLDIPVDSWSRLWTRDPDAGSASFDMDAQGTPVAMTVTHSGQRDWALGTGLRVSVQPGEKLRLSSTASLEGTGSLSMELVARRADGTVMSWAYANVRVPSGPSRPVAADFVVQPGIDTMEPRWSGSGPSQARVGDFRLERLSTVP